MMSIIYDVGDNMLEKLEVYIDKKDLDTIIERIYAGKYKGRMDLVRTAIKNQLKTDSVEKETNGN